jgi:hypothetical protein
VWVDTVRFHHRPDNGIGQDPIERRFAITPIHRRTPMGRPGERVQLIDCRVFRRLAECFHRAFPKFRFYVGFLSSLAVEVFEDGLVVLSQKLAGGDAYRMSNS